MLLLIGLVLIDGWLHVNQVDVRFRSADFVAELEFQEMPTLCIMGFKRGLKMLIKGR